MTASCVLAERAMSRALAGSCQVPLGGFAEMAGGRLTVRGFVASVDGKRMIRDEVAGDPVCAEALGEMLAQKLLSQGAGDILAELDN
jgi:hydroxymethylbilane synthase